MSVSMNVHHVTRHVFDTLPGDEGPLYLEAVSPQAWVKNLDLTPDFQISVFCDEPPVEGLVSAVAEAVA